ncbi:hypothetical protein [Microcystis phage Mwe-JY26]
MRAMIQAQVKGAMAMLKGMGLGEVITYHHVTAPTYDPSTGVVENNSRTFSNIPAVLPGFSLDEKDDSIVVTTDRKALIAYSDLPVEPTDNDWFLTSNGEKWEVKRALGVPGESLHKLHVRRA